MKPDLQKIQIVPQEKTGPIFAQRESGVRHTPYQAETAFYNCIKAGDCALLERKMEEYFQSGFVVGRLSGDPLRQMQYWAVSSVTLATRAALEGGLDELHAYNFSDRCIQTVDTLQSPEQIVEYLTQQAYALTELVARTHGRLHYSPHVRKCVTHIDRCLHENLRVTDLADICGVSADYLSAIFKKEVGVPLRRYILQEKLKEACRMLENGCSCSRAAYILSFCSESYFIACFKRAYGVTPHVWASEHRRYDFQKNTET